MVMNSPSLLRAQLGHPSLARVQQLVPSLYTLSSLSCESCHLGKHSSSSFPSNVSQCVSFSFVLVHSNNWESSCVKSNLRFQYFFFYFY